MSLSGLLVLGSLAAAAEDTQERFVVSAELGTWAAVSRGALAVEARVYSLPSQRLHASVGAGVGATSFYLYRPFPDAHLTAGLWTGQGAHHFEARAGAARVSNTVPGDGAYLYPLVQLGYRHQSPDQPLVWTASLGTTGLSGSVGWAFSSLRSR